ncbi:hypothetical protein [Pseudoclavibacter sp. 13-3]|uniref:hypothetical protein n=1 Tax=Pseudoclavibacter sp. 13-3 TaxID=2901228 RepID=UPI001E552D43|nr:hypothetical protein [Pseudoclavibacter sp. 13-3]MCD7101954.1 hypothetical protein [Pseudoclavibacter sp. 13-3]
MTREDENGPAVVTHDEAKNITDINKQEDIEMTDTNSTNTAAPRPTWAATVERTHDGDGLEVSVATSAVITLEHDSAVTVRAEQWAAHTGARAKVEPAAIVVTDRGDGVDQDIIVRSAAVARDLATALVQLAESLWLTGEARFLAPDESAPYAVHALDGSEVFVSSVLGRVKVVIGDQIVELTPEAARQHAAHLTAAANRAGGDTDER